MFEKSDYLNNDDDYIVSNNYVRYITKTKNGEEQGQHINDNNEEEKHFVSDLKSIAEEFQNRESSIPNVEMRILNLSGHISKEELLSRPVLEFIVQNKDWEESEVEMLERKIEQIRDKNHEEKIKMLQEN